MHKQEDKHFLGKDLVMACHIPPLQKLRNLGKCLTSLSPIPSLFLSRHQSAETQCRVRRYMYLHLTTLEGFTTMVANEGLEKAEPMNPGPPGPTALHPLRRMRCELFQVKHLQEHTYSFFRVELSQLLGERNLLWQWWDSNLQPFD